MDPIGTGRGHRDCKDISAKIVAGLVAFPFMIIDPDKGREKGFGRAQSLRVQSVTAGKSWEHKRKAVGHTSSSQNIEQVNACLSVFPFHIIHIPSQKMVSSTVGGSFFPTQLTKSR